VRALLFLPVLAAALPVAAVAQGPISPGRQVTGIIASNDEVMEDNTPFDAWRLSARARHRYRVTMRAEAFDAFLVIGRTVNGSFTELVRDDDSGGGENGLDAQATFTASTDGEIIIRANTVGEDAEGPYTLEVTDIGEAAPIRATSITPTPSSSGALDSRDAMTSENRPVDYYRFTARAGRRYSATLSAADFDAFLEQGTGANGAFTSERTDDDGGGGTNARIEWVQRTAGEVWLAARSFNADTGRYSLLLMDLGDAPPPSAAMSLERGRSLTGSLDAGDETAGSDGPFDTYVVSGEGGQVVVITMSSDAFDPIVAIGRDGETWTQLDSDDDGGLGTNARLEFRLPSSGRFLVRARALSSNSRGAYTIRWE
jgi:hypothetical protein